MSLQAGHPPPSSSATATSTQADNNNNHNNNPSRQQQQQRQQQPPPSNCNNNNSPQTHFTPPQFSSLDLATQQAILQQFAAARGAGNPAAAAFLANLTNNLGARKQSGSNAPPASASTPTVNGSGAPSAPSPSVSSATVSLPTPGASGINAPSPSAAQTPDVAALQAQLQARLIHAQQQAIHAAAVRQAGGGIGQAAGAPQSAQSPAADNSPRVPSGLPEWAAAAAASGMLSNLGTDREAIMKQLQALHQSQQNRVKHAASLGVGSPVNPTVASPAAMTAPSPASAAAPSPAASASAPTPTNTNFLPEPSAPSPNIMSALASVMRPGMTGMTPTTPTSTGLPVGLPAHLSGQPGATSGVRPNMPVRPPFIQKQQLLNSLVAYYRSTNQTLPPEVFNGEHDGAFKLGGVWIELIDLFMAVFRLGGLIKLMQTSHPQTANPADHPVWQHILVSKGVSLTLPTPVQLPKQPGMAVNAQPQMTTSSVQYLVAGYRAWIFGFEQAMARTKLAAFQKQQQAAAAAGMRPQGAGTPATPTAPGPPVGMPSGMTPAAASPQASMAPPTPVAAAPTPPVAAPTPPAPSPAPSQFPAPPTPIDTAPPAAPSPAFPAPSPKTIEDMSGPKAGTPGSQKSTPKMANGTPPAVVEPPPPKQKRKRDRDLRASSESKTPVTPRGRSGTPAQPAGPPLPKRPRYRVEYNPLHFPHPMTGGWDERTITSSFSKHKFGRPTHAAQELQVDIEGILMGLKSRLPMEIGYGMTVLSMLSMPLHDGKAPNLPIEPLTDVYLEVLDLIAESALGEGGISQWLEEQQQPTTPLSTSRSSVSREHIERMTYAELEQLGNDVEYCVEDETGTSGDQTGGKTDIIFAGLNIIRNFSMLADNQFHMARPELFNVLAAVTDKALMRLPGEQSDRPFSVLEYARVCRDSVSIIANLGGWFDLRLMAKPTVLAVFRLIASFLVSAWEVLQKREPGFGPTRSIREVAPTTILSVDRALEAFCRLTLPDHNREIVSSVVPGDELVELFDSLVKLFPISQREIEALRSIEDYLARVELIALSVYSLAFLAPQHARSHMRTTSGATSVMTRLVYGLAPLSAADMKGSPFAFLVRRIAETLGVLNGTVTPGGNAQGMSFSAGGIDGKGWRFASNAVEPGWLAYDAERVLEAMGWGRGDGRIWRIDGSTFAELDGLWSA